MHLGRGLQLTRSTTDNFSRHLHYFFTTTWRQDLLKDTVLTTVLISWRETNCRFLPCSNCSFVRPGCSTTSLSWTVIVVVFPLQNAWRVCSMSITRLLTSIHTVSIDTCLMLSQLTTKVSKRNNLLWSNSVL